jgi:hypothetical protein
LLATSHSSRSPLRLGQTTRATGARGNPDSHEFKKIQFAIGASASAIHTRLREAPTWFKVQELRDRPVPETAGARIMSAQGNQVLGRSLRDLAELWERHSPLSSPSIEEQKSEVNLVIELLRAARNRLFHGEKRFDPDGRDAELFSLLCPVLFAVSGPMLERLGGH